MFNMCSYQFLLSCLPIWQRQALMTYSARFSLLLCLWMFKVLVAQIGSMDSQTCSLMGHFLNYCFQSQWFLVLYHPQLFESLLTKLQGELLMIASFFCSRNQTTLLELSSTVIHDHVVNFRQAHHEPMNFCVSRNLATQHLPVSCLPNWGAIYLQANYLSYDAFYYYFYLMDLLLLFSQLDSYSLNSCSLYHLVFVILSFPHLRKDL